MQNWTEDILADFRPPARLRSRALAPGADRRRRRLAGAERPVPVGLPPHRRAASGAQSLRRNRANRRRARACRLCGSHRRPPADLRRRSGDAPVRPHPDGRDVDLWRALAVRADLRSRHPGRRFGRACLWTQSGGGGIADIGAAALGLCAARSEAAYRHGIRSRREPRRHPHLGASAGRPSAGTFAERIRPVLQSVRNMERAGRRLDEIYRALLVHAAAGPRRGGHRVLLWRGSAGHRPVRRQAGR